MTQPRHETLTVSQVMARNIEYADPMASVRQAMRQMRDRNVSSLVIPRRDPGDEPAIVDIQDIGREVIARSRSIDRVDVYEVMTKPALNVPAEMDIKYAVRMLVRFGQSRAVVVDHDRNVVGIVTLRDMVIAAADLAESPA
ncbi:MAG: CBS domain-containing protein [Proteobacteria bacterium]|nr:CBS domain-containing protein [Pseudomonadota bacterium]MDA1132342.1 CBS domain-containing protein [Pseudomonadota bacterium]